MAHYPYYMEKWNWWIKSCDYSELNWIGFFLSSHWFWKGWNCLKWFLILITINREQMKLQRPYGVCLCVPEERNGRVTQGLHCGRHVSVHVLICSFPLSHHCVLCQVWNFLCQDDGGLNLSCIIHEWLLDVLIDVIVQAVEVSVCSLQQYKRIPVKISLQQRRLPMCCNTISAEISVFLLNVYQIQHAAIGLTSTWEGFLLTVCLLLSKFLLLYISCSTSRNCLFLAELSCLES